MSEPYDQLSLIEGGSTKYCIDSCVFFSFWGDKRRFPVEHYKPLWEYIEQKLKSREVIASEEVYREIKDHSDNGFQKWLKENKQAFFVDNNDKIIEFASKIINENPRIYFVKKSNGADPFTISVAKVYNLTVITEERPMSDKQLNDGACPTIPNLCDSYGVECVDVLGFCANEGFQLGPVK